MEKIEVALELFLVLLNDELEHHGVTIGECTFNVGNIASYKHFIQENMLSEDEYHKIVNICLSRKYITHTFLGDKARQSLRLTREGQAVAISVKRSQNKPKQSIVPSETQSGPINFYNCNNIQVGNGNTQNLTTIYKDLIMLIENSDASAKEKEEAKGLLGEIFENPLLNGILGSIAGSIAGGMV